MSEKSAETSGNRPHGGKGQPWGLSAGSEALTELHKCFRALEKKVYGLLLVRVKIHLST